MHIERDVVLEHSGLEHSVHAPIIRYINGGFAYMVLPHTEVTTATVLGGGTLVIGSLHGDVCIYRVSASGASLVQHCNVGAPVTTSASFAELALGTLALSNFRDNTIILVTNGSIQTTTTKLFTPWNCCLVLSNDEMLICTASEYMQGDAYCYRVRHESGTLQMR